MSGTLELALAYPPAAFLYRATKPTVVIDGVPQPEAPWGTRRFELPAGRHRVDVHVPYVMPRRAGKAALEVTVPSSGAVRIEYLAPTITFARGSLGAPGEQVSAGATAVKWANMVALVLMVVFFVVLVAFF